MGQPHTALGDVRATNLTAGDDVLAGMNYAAHRNPPGRMSRVQRENLKTRRLQTPLIEASLDPNRADKPHTWTASLSSIRSDKVNVSIPNYLQQKTIRMVP
jgi:hypothetical protein